MTNILYFICIIIGILSITKSLGIIDMTKRVLSLSEIKSKFKLKQSIDQPVCGSELETLSKQFDQSQCDLITDGPLCLYSGDRILLPFAAPKGLIGYWNFDEIKPLDYSGNGNHGVGITQAGSSFGGFGSSAYFSSGNYIRIPYNSSFKSDDYTITFLLFIIQDYYASDKGLRYCPLFQRGEDDLLSKNFKRSPAMYYDRKEKNLKLYVKTTSESNSQGESLISNAKISNQRWLHIAAVKQAANIKIYVNGILDSQTAIVSSPEDNNSDLYIGGAPWLKDQCDFPFLIDELRYYNKSIDEDTIQAEASPILGGIEPSFIQLGCMNCDLKEASESCADDYRLCSNIEMHTGGYQIARSLGWISWNSHLWTNIALKTPDDFKRLKGLALCCAELK